jgi:aminopeptidase N
MSTYLVAYVIGAYEYVETRDSNNVLVRVYTAIGEKERGLFALHVRFFCDKSFTLNDLFQTAAKILPFYAEYFGSKYPLSKVDMIAIADFGSGK